VERADRLSGEFSWSIRLTSAGQPLQRCRRHVGAALVPTLLVLLNHGGNSPYILHLKSHFLPRGFFMMVAIAVRLMAMLVAETADLT
jgi:hypothetical protein